MIVGWFSNLGCVSCRSLFFAAGIMVAVALAPAGVATAITTISSSGPCSVRRSPGYGHMWFSFNFEAYLCCVFYEANEVAFIRMYLLLNRMMVLSDDLACSLMRGNRKPLGTTNNTLSITYVFNSNMLYNVKRLKCSCTSRYESILLLVL